MRGPLINLGHALDHLVMLIYPTVILSLMTDFQQSYAALLALSLGGFVAFGAFSLPAGWLADRWSRDGMMAVFFFGTGLSCLLAALTQTPLQMALALTAIGVFAAIYHPVAAPLLVSGNPRMGRTLGINGFFGNFGVAIAALVSGALTDLISWRAAFAVPGALLILGGISYLAFVPLQMSSSGASRKLEFGLGEGGIRRLLMTFLITALIAGLIFSSTTIAMPKVFSERIGAFTSSATGIGAFVFAVFLFAGVAQIVVGPLIDRYSVRPVLIGVIALQIPFLFLAGDAQGFTLIVISALMMFGVFGQIPINDVIIGRYVPDAFRARAYALRYLISFTASAAAVPFLAYIHTTGQGFGLLFPVLAGLAGVMFIAALAIPTDAEMEASTGSKPASSLSPAE